mgnify:CR=1 FL=1
MTESKRSFAEDFKARVRNNKTSRWIRFGIVSLIFFLWVIWLGTWWVALFWFLLFDIYITGYIPFTWWKKSKSAAVRGVMGWVDAIVYALILVYFVFTYVGQNYQIPSSSLEKSLLIGDYLWVNKMAYGPRVPNTPVHFPLVQNTFPIINTKSYLETPQWKYHRLAGLGNVERGDIVVFNFPAGDTVAVKVQNPDYYTLVKLYGREALRANPETFGEIIYRPVDRRENYVKRAIGLPGERLKITDGVVYINGEVALDKSGNSFSAINLGQPKNDAQGKAHYFNIGYSYASGRELHGEICECRIWNVVRTQEEIASHVYEVDPASEGLVAYWKFDEGTGDTIRDQTGNGNNGTADSPLKWTEVSLPETAPDAN